MIAGIVSIIVLILLVILVVGKYFNFIEVLCIQREREGAKIA